MDHFEDQYSADTAEPLGLPFDEEANFFHPEEVHDGDEFPARLRPKSPSTPMTRFASISAKWVPSRF
jgi:hypothetical protein